MEELFKLKIDESKIQYYINTEKKTVTCIINNLTIYHTLMDYKPSQCYAALAVGGCLPSIIGVAKCNDADVFDIEIGKRIARAKAENKLYIKYYEGLINTIHKLNHKVVALNVMLIHYNEKKKQFIESNKQFINKLGN